MVLELLIIPFVFIINFIINLVPATPEIEPVLSGFLTLIGQGINFFGVPMFSIIIANITFWSTFQLGWGVIEWVYKKIPGVS